MQNTGLQGSTSPSPAAAPNLSEQATSRLSQLTDTAQQTIERLTQVASQAASRIGGRTQELWDAQGPAVDKARTYMREHPVATIAIAVGIGLVLSKLLSRR